MPADDPLLTVLQAADQLGTTVRYVRYLIETRQIQYQKIGRRYVRIYQSVLDKFKDSGTVPARGQVA